MAARKKHPSARARANRAPSAATLSESNVIAASRRPKLPPRYDAAGKVTAWHPEVKRWWASIWASPMAPEWHPSDLGRLLMIAKMIQSFWTTDSPQQLSMLAGEVRLSSAKFGLTPADRRTLEWSIEQVAEAQDRGKARRTNQAPPAKTGTPAARKAAASDPRRALRAV